MTVRKFASFFFFFSVAVVVAFIAFEAPDHRTSAFGFASAFVVRSSVRPKAAATAAASLGIDARTSALPFRHPRRRRRRQPVTSRGGRALATSTGNDDNVDVDDDEVYGDFSFFDEASLYVRAGSGGQGASTYKKAKKGANGIPDGGSGGVGGNVVLELSPGLNTLAGFAGGGSFRAWDGGDGGRMYDNGRGGEDCVIRVPPGTVARLETASRGSAEETAAADDGEGSPENARVVDLGTVSRETPTIVVARGGRGGEGTAVLKGKKKGASRRGPGGGERGTLRLTLTIVADIALVGVPNAGKSTFLAAVTRAKPRIADYPFTTIVPNLGTWLPPVLDRPSSDRGGSGNRQRKTTATKKAAAANALVLCDVPGLIAGASEGVGLGHAFLRHIERCRVILHLVDATSDDPTGDLAMVNEELKRYGTGSLAAKPQVVVLNKMDAVAFGGGEDGGGDDTAADDDRRESLVSRMKDEMGHTRLLWVSAKEKDGVDDLMTRMASYVGKMKEEDEEKQRALDEAAAAAAADASVA